MKQSEQDSLKRCILLWFLAVLAGVQLLAQVQQGLLNRYVNPQLLQLFPELQDYSLSLWFLLWMFLLVLFNAISSMAPGIAGLVRAPLAALQNVIFSLLPGGERFASMSAARLLSLFALTLLQILLQILPYLLGAALYAVLVLRKIQKMEAQLEQDRKERERERNLMLSDMAHDLRTPITTVYGYAKAISDGVVTDEETKREYLQAILNKSQRMTELINLMFDYVRLDSEGFSLHLERVELGELLRQNAALAYPDLEAAGMELQIQIPEEPFYIQADALQLSRLITNLLVNARRHNPAGTVVLLSMLPGPEGITVAVADSGEVISPETAEHLFDPFYMGDKSRSSRGGSGLGLSIARKVAQQHGWTLDYQAEYPGYTKAFVMKLPWKA